MVELLQKIENDLLEAMLWLMQAQLDFHYVKVKVKAGYVRYFILLVCLRLNVFMQ